MVDFALDEEQEALRDLATEVLAGPPPGWDDLVGSGLVGAVLPTDVGGSGLGFVAVHLLLEQLGAAGSDLPLWETVVLGALPVAELGTEAQRRALLGAMSAGRTPVTAALLDDQPGGPLRPQATAVADGGSWTLAGVKTLVPVTEDLERVLVPATTDDGRVVLLLVDPHGPGAELRPQEVVGGQPRAELVLAGASVPGADVLVGPDRGAGALEWLVERAHAGLASLLAGACAGALRLAASYTSQRRQFDRPLSSFQAVGQRLADAYVDTEAARLAALQAAWRLEEGLPASEEVAVAAWWAAEASHRVVHAAHHVHGGTGVDRGYPLHRYWLLAKQAELSLGGASSHLAALGAALADAP